MLFFPFKFWRAVSTVKKIMRQRKVTALVGMGGYVSAPAIRAARKLGLPVYLCEQNTVPGKVIRHYLKQARRVYTTFESTRDFVKPQFRDKLLCAGNPIRSAVFYKGSREEARASFNLQHCRTVILAIGGSQGAVQINELILGLKLRYPHLFREVGVIWCTGAYSLEKYRQIAREHAEIGSVYISPFVEDVGRAYRAADLAISRSGAGVMMELAAMGVPSILIPYPFATMDHQSYNADAFADRGAALKIANNEAVAEKCGERIFDLLDSPHKLQRMSDAALALALPEAARTMLDDILSGR
jgi:UDP-N-acetylglucosamine--N-acetylmuramyl-(pentapeptide) pyrophosphoryl-undecaprenol N-acetylglucosamine transferase